MKKIIICIFVICINHQAFSKPPRPIFQRMKVKVNNIIIDVEVADTLEEQSYGLMYIEKPLKENQGMLFVYDYAKPLTFWMKNTFIPLSIGFFDKNKKLINIEEMQSSSLLQMNYDTAKSQGLAQYALEMNIEWFKKNNVQPGHRLEFFNSNKGLKSSSP